MGWMFIVGYALTIVALILYLTSKKISALKNKESIVMPLVISLTIIGIYYIAIAISQGDPYMSLLWILGLILAAILTGIGNDIYSYLKTGSKVRNYYESLREDKHHDTFKFEEKEIRNKLKTGCPLFKK